MPLGERLDTLLVQAIAQPGSGADGDRSLRADLHGLVDQILGPVALGGRDISGQRKPRQCGQRDIVGPANADFSHGNLEQLPADHTWVNAIAEASGLSEAELKDHPKRQVLTKAV